MNKWKSKTCFRSPGLLFARGTSQSSFATYTTLGHNNNLAKANSILLWKVCLLWWPYLYGRAWTGFSIRIRINLNSFIIISKSPWRHFGLIWLDWPIEDWMLASLHRLHPWALHEAAAPEELPRSATDQTQFWRVWRWHVEVSIQIHLTQFKDDNPIKKTPGKSHESDRAFFANGTGLGAQKNA